MHPYLSKNIFVFPRSRAMAEPVKREATLRYSSSAALSIAALLLVGCGPSTTELTWRSGANLAQVANANTQCQVYALQQVPRAISTNTTPTYTTPANVSCTTMGNYTSCHDYGSQTYGGQTVTEDLNSGLRDRVAKQCLAQQGIQVVSFDICTEEQAKRAVSSQVLPPASQVECVTRSSTGFVLR